MWQQVSRVPRLPAERECATVWMGTCVSALGARLLPPFGSWESPREDGHVLAVLSLRYVLEGQLRDREGILWLVLLRKLQTGFRAAAPRYVPNGALGPWFLHVLTNTRLVFLLPWQPSSWVRGGVSGGLVCLAPTVGGVERLLPSAVSSTQVCVVSLLLSWGCMGRCAGRRLQRRAGTEGRTLGTSRTGGGGRAGRGVTVGDDIAAGVAGGLGEIAGGGKVTRRWPCGCMTPPAEQNGYLSRPLVSQKLCVGCGWGVRSLAAVTMSEERVTGRCGEGGRVHGATGLKS